MPYPGSACRGTDLPSGRLLYIHYVQMGLKLPNICLAGEEKPRKNLAQETCPDRGSNTGPLRDRRPCYRLFHSGGLRTVIPGIYSDLQYVFNVTLIEPLQISLYTEGRNSPLTSTKEQGSLVLSGSELGLPGQYADRNEYEKPKSIANNIHRARRAGSDGNMSASSSAGPGFDPRRGSKF